MYKSRKAAVSSDEMAGIIIFIIALTLLILLSYAVNYFGQSSKQKKVITSIEEINAQYNLNYFLKLQIEPGKNVADLIGEEKNDLSKTKALHDKFFNEIYGTKGLDYAMKIDGETISFVNIPGSVAHVVIQIPLLTKQIADIELSIGQYNPKSRPLQ